MDKVFGEVRSGVPALTDSLVKYARVRGKTSHEVLNRKGRDLAFKLYRGFRELRPEKGAINSEAKSRFKSGRGTKVRRSILEKMKLRSRLTDQKTVFGNSKRGQTSAKRGDKRLNWWQEAVRRELGLRSRGSGYLSLGWLFRDWKNVKDPQSRKLSRFDRLRRFIAKTEHTFNKKESKVRLLNITDGVEAVSKRKGVIRSALSDVRRDTESFLNRKQGESIGRLIRKNYRAVKLA